MGDDGIKAMETPTDRRDRWTRVGSKLPSAVRLDYDVGIAKSKPFMRHRIRHITEYTYDEQVPLCHNVVHLQPRDTDRQTCLSTCINITPEPASRRDRLDFYGNHVTSLTLQEPHDHLRIESKSEVDVRPFQPPELFRWPAWEEVAQQIRRRLEPAFLDARQYTFDSPHIPRHPDLAAFAATSFTPGRSTWDAVEELSERIHSGFKFDSTVTTIGTPVLDVLKHRHGVCQDFAHLMIGSIRSLGLAALREWLPGHSSASG